MSKATHKSAPVSPRKAAIVAKLVRGRTVEDALTILAYTPRKAAGLIADAIESAVANARNNDKIKDELQLSQIRVTQGSHLRRYRAGAMGAAKPYKKHRAHIHVELEPVPKTDNTDNDTAKKAKSTVKESK